jgi:hypothetical protein
MCVGARPLALPTRFRLRLLAEHTAGAIVRQIVQTGLEALERVPTRSVTGYFVAARCTSYA